MQKLISSIFITFLLLNTVIYAKTPSYQELLESMEVKNSFSENSLNKTTSQRPTYLDKTYTSALGHFKIHYTTEGSHAVSNEITNPDNVPDWVFATAEVAEMAYHLLIDSLGFDAPPVDGTEGDEYDIYIIDTPYYGQTHPERKNNETVRPDDYISFMTLENDFVGEYNYKTHGYDALNVTVVHEFFHAVQLGYNYNTENYLSGMNSGDVFFFEWSSVWFEEYCFPEVNDYVFYAKNYSYYPDDVIWAHSYWYSHGIFMKYLIDNYSIDILTKTWNKIKNNQRAFYALMESIDEETDAPLAEIYNEFCQAMYYTGNKYDEKLAVSTDAQFFPNLRISWADRYEYDNLLNISREITQFSTAPIQVAFSSAQHFGILKNKAFDKNFTGSYVFDDNNQSTGKKIDLSSDFYIDKSGNGDTLFVFLTNSDYENPQSLEISIDYVKPPQHLAIQKLFPNPVDGNGAINISLFQTEQLGEIKINIYNLLGQKIYHQNYYPTKDNLLQVDLGSITMSSGIYFIQLQAGATEKTQKFTVIK